MSQRIDRTRRCTPTGIGAAIALAFLVSAMAANQASAQGAWPSRPVRILVPFGAGSNTDTLARRIAEFSAQDLGAKFVVENRPGANGLIAARELLSAPRDGHAIMVSSVSVHAANAYLYRNLGYDPIKDFSPISGITINPGVIVTRVDLPARSLRELIDYGKANPGKLNFGSGNSSSLASLALMRNRGGFTAVDVPYKSQPDAVTDLLGGRIDIVSIDWNIVRDHVRAGKLRALAVTAKSRLRTLPDVPTIAETLPGYEVNGWVATFAPAGAPAEVVLRLSQSFGQFVRSAEFQKYAEEQGMIGFATTPDELGAFQREQIRFWAEILSAAGVPRE